MHWIRDPVLYRRGMNSSFIKLNLSFPNDRSEKNNWQQKYARKSWMTWRISRKNGQSYMEIIEKVVRTPTNKKKALVEPFQGDNLQ